MSWRTWAPGNSHQSGNTALLRNKGATPTKGGGGYPYPSEPPLPAPVVSEEGSALRMQLKSRLHAVVHLHRQMQMAKAAATIDDVMTTIFPCPRSHAQRRPQAT